MPSYCAAVNNFKSAAQQLGNLNVAQNGVAGVISALKSVESAGEAAVAAVKTSFVAETTALKNSLTSLKATVSQLANSQTRASAIAQLPGQIVKSRLNKRPSKAS